jgi:hypothetical protein
MWLFRMDSRLILQSTGTTRVFALQQQDICNVCSVIITEHTYSWKGCNPWVGILFYAFTVVRLCYYPILYLLRTVFWDSSALLV